MLRFIPAVFFAFIALNCHSQNKIDKILENKITQVNKLDRSDLRTKVFLKTEFNNSELISTKPLSRLKGKTVTQVDLVFTTYKEHLSFEQIKLNKKRLIALKKVAPALINNPLVRWRLIGQKSSLSIEDAKKSFHGFVVHYRNTCVITRETEIKYLDSFLERETEITITEDEPYTCPRFNYRHDDYWKYMIKNLKYPSIKNIDTEPGMSIASALIDTNGKLKDIVIESSLGKGFDIEFISMLKKMPLWIPAKVNGKKTARRVTIPAVFDRHGDLNYKELYDCYKALSCKAVTPPRKSFTIPMYNDSTLYKVFNRNPKWNKMIVVTDVTGSMYPYIAQLLVWHQLNLKTKKDKVKQITFFNDGDSKRAKPIGSTGGIYHTKSREFDDFKAVLYKAMKAGSGGDQPENNIEAVLKAIKSCPKGEDIIMVADNYTTPRDLMLAKKINQPIKIILCGAYENINIEYLNLARELKGSIHTMSEDIADLAKYNEGESVFIAGKEFKLEKGVFVPVFSM